jgi:uncharacterized repeat protein (TIGR01451 family)
LWQFYNDKKQIKFLASEQPSNRKKRGQFRVPSGQSERLDGKMQGGHLRFLLKVLIFFLMFVLIGSAMRGEDLYVKTTIRNAQSQIDTNHTTKLSVSSRAVGNRLAGAILTMKRGVATLQNSTVVFSVWSDRSKTTLIAAKSLTKASFTTQFAPVTFAFTTPINLTPGVSYYAEVTSTASDVQSQAYFIKGINGCYTVDASGVMVAGGSCNFDIPAAPYLVIAKSTPSPSLRAGNQSTYTLTVSNVGTGAAKTATVKDALPSGLSFVSATGTNWTCANSNGTVTCSYSNTTGIPAGGTSTIAITVTANSGTTGNTVTNYASTDTTGGSTVPTPGSNCTDTDACAAVTSKIDGAQLQIAKSQPSPGLFVGATSTYTLTVTNTGASAATTAKVLDQLPTQLTFVSATGTNWSCTGASGLITCTFSGGSIAAGGTSTISVVVTTALGGGSDVLNVATIDPTGGASPPDPATCIPSPTCVQVISTIAAPSLSISKGAPTPGLSVGSQSTYRLTVTNYGNGIAKTASVKDALPSGLTYQSYSAASGWSCSHTSGTVTCTYSSAVGIAASGGTSTIDITVSANSGTTATTVTNYASIDPTGGTGPATPGAACTNPYACASVISKIDGPQLTIQKSAPSPSLAKDATSTYTLYSDQSWRWRGDIRDHHR